VDDEQVGFGTHAGKGTDELVRAAGSLLDAVRGLRWPARDAVAGGTVGTHRSRRQGAAVEFTEYRAYRQGDDTRRIDWRLFARTDRAYLRITDDHSVHPMRIVLDASASMAFPTDTRAKWRAAQLMAIGLAAVARATGDPVTVAVVGESTIRQRSLRGDRALVAELVSVVGDNGVGGRAHLAPVVRAGLVDGRPAARLILISDWLGDLDETIAAAREARATGAAVFVVHVVAAEELEPEAGAHLVSDPEEASLRRVLTDRTRARYQAAFGAWRERVRDAWRGAGAMYVAARAGDDPAAIVRRLVRTAAAGSAAAAS
jgi:uncharacterized protein (DUF58 family)